MPDPREAEEHLDEGYVIFRYSGVYDGASLSLDMIDLMSRASTEEILNLRALIVDLSAVSKITMAESDISMNTHVFQKIKSQLPSADIDMEAIATHLQRLIICPAHLREAWSERMVRIQNAGVWQRLPQYVFHETTAAAVAAVNPIQATARLP
ncbi:MAG: hypothetical protein ACJASY_004194 [Halioglobus sp.]|jgi:hypothetical protein